EPYRLADTVRRIAGSAAPNWLVDRKRKKAQLKQPGRESFGRGCLKGSSYMRLDPILCKCEKLRGRCEILK
ncbi:hypothetical protein, partial [Novosphingobium rosa]|uniref:hypothetical protein n=1 Tax=Novosphingobium rosa TaxID=76978 RepID=UPI001C3F8A21